MLFANNDLIKFLKFYLILPGKAIKKCKPILTAYDHLVYDLKMEFYTLNEVAKYLRVHPRSIERWLTDGRLKGYKLGNSRTSVWRIRKNEVERFIVAKEKIKNG